MQVQLEQPAQPSESVGKQATVSPVGAVNQADRAAEHSQGAQEQDPEIGQGDDQQQTLHTLGISQVAGVEMEAHTFVVPEHRLNPETTFVPVKCFVGQGKVGDQVHGCLFILVPGNDEIDGAELFACPTDVF